MRQLGCLFPLFAEKQRKWLIRKRELCAHPAAAIHGSLPAMEILLGMIFGFFLWLGARYGIGGFYTVGPNQRAVLCTFGKAQRMGDGSTLSDPIAQSLTPEEAARYAYPVLKVIGPGIHWKLPWQSFHRVSIATSTVSIAYDPENESANDGGRFLEAVTKDQLNTGLTGQLRFTISDRNLYPVLFGVKNPVAHVMGYFVSILRDRIANFEVPQDAQHDDVSAEVGAGVQGISINDLRKNLRDLNERMDEECAAAAARYGITLDAALITAIDPPAEVDSALAAINTAHNHVSSAISLAQAAADQRIVQSRRAVEIETLNAQAEVEPLLTQAAQLRELAAAGGMQAVHAYVRNAKITLHRRTKQLVLTTESEVAK